VRISDAGLNSETCCTRLPGNAGRKKSPKIAIWAPSLLGYIFATKEKGVKQRYVLQINATIWWTSAY